MEIMEIVAIMEIVEIVAIMEGIILIWAPYPDIEHRYSEKNPCSERKWVKGPASIRGSTGC
jgi:hypothetical protein